MRNYILTILACFLVSATGLRAQENYKQEFRAVWMATVGNLDWPKDDDRGDAAAQQADLIRMLDLYASLNMNSLILQVRPECDAFYQSAYEPWSRYLGTFQGQDPGYDPLQFAIDEAHKRGIELHAWLNPYRINASPDPADSYFAETHIYKEHPEWAMKYASGTYILNPGMPQVMSYIGAVVRDLVSNYDVDGVHFDDYFYLYEGTTLDMDQAEYDLYGEGMTRGDWRRDNVNRMIDTVHRIIQEEKPWVRFGVSPFGIYRNGVPAGTSGTDAYSQLYCDALAWLEDESVDYLTPQLYWPTGGRQDFETLVNWWSDQVQTYGRHLIPGQGIFKMPTGKKSALKTTGLHEEKAYTYLSNMEQSLAKGTSDPVSAWTNEEIGLEIELIRANRAKGAMGNVFFRSEFLETVPGLIAYLADNTYLTHSLMPEMSWKPDDTPASPTNVRIELVENEYMLYWDATLEKGQRFAVYVSDGESDEQLIISEPAFLQGSYYENMATLADLSIFANSWITVTAVSATGRESNPSTAIDLYVDLPIAEIVSPASDAEVGQEDLLSWSSDGSTPEYQFQVGSNSSFNNLVYESGWTTSTSVSVESLDLQGETGYFWRVRAREDVTGPWTPGNHFTCIFPGIPELVYPNHLASMVSTTPTVQWNSSDVTDTIWVEISESGTFDPLVARESFLATDKQGKLTAVLEKSTWYNIRIQGANDYGSSDYDNYHIFETSAGDIPEVELVGPDDGTTVASFDKLQWSTTAREGTITYMLEIALDEEFSSLLYRSDWIPAPEISVSELGMEGKRTHYWHVKGSSEFGESLYSASRSFTTGYPTRPALTSPPHLTTEVSTMPELAWDVDADADSVIAEFSEKSDFASIFHSEMMDAKPGTGVISRYLKGYTWYYCRIRAINDYGHSVNSPLRYFATGISNSIDESKKDGLVKIWPNPLHEGMLRIQIPEEIAHDAVLRVVDVCGRECMLPDVADSMKGADHVIELNREDFPAPGLYHIIITSRQNLERIAVVIK